MEITLTKPSDVRAYERNPRDNSEAIEKVAASIREYGWTQPIVVDEEGIILAGHTRHLAAQELGLRQVPVYWARGLTEAQKKAYRIMDNRSGEIADWDNDMLRKELEELSQFDFDMELTGFDLDELAKLTGDSLLQFAGETDELDIEMDEELSEAFESSNVKMVMLYLDTKTEPLFKAMCERLQQKHGIDNLSDLVFKVIKDAHSKVDS